MSWAAHDLEPYVVQKHMGKKVAFVPLLIGPYSPDLLSKWFVYGVGLAGWELKADNPASFTAAGPASASPIRWGSASSSACCCTRSSATRSSPTAS